MSKNSNNPRRKKQNRQPYWVVIWDEAVDLPDETLVEADCAEQAEAEAIEALNEENGYGPHEDGGFSPVVVYDRSDVLGILERMDKHRDQP